MPLIIVHNDPSGVGERSTFSVEAGTLISEWIMHEWPNGLPMRTRIYLNDTTENDLLFSLPEDGPKDHLIGVNDIIHIVQTPGEFATVVAIISLVVGVASAFLIRPNIPVPENPEFKQPLESPNNSLSGQTNIARPLQRIPDIYGKNKVWPDLIAKSYSEFIDHIKYVTEYLCVGVGEYLVEDLKTGETLISDIEGSTATIFGPNTRPAELLDVTESNEVNGQELYSTAASGSINIVATGDFAGSTFESLSSGMGQLVSLSPGDSITIAGTTSNNGVFTFQSLTFDPSDKPNFSYILTVSETFTNEFSSTATITSTAARSSSFGPIVVNGGTDEIWIDIQCPQGLQDDTDTAFTVTIDVTLQRLDGGGSPLGPPETPADIVITDSTLDPRFYTFKYVPANPGDPYEVTLERLTGDPSTVNGRSQTKWSRLAGVDDLTISEVADFGNITTVLINTKATEQATSIQQRKFNAVVTRKLVTYDTGTQTISVTPAATAKMADAVLHHLTDSNLGNKPVAQLDLDELYTIQDALDSVTNYGDTLGRFCRTFSDSKTPVEDELRTILNAGRCMHYQEGQIMRFIRDEIRPNRTALFNSRVKDSKSESKTVNFFKAGDHDGVELQWIDETTGDASIILLPSPSGGSNNLRIDGAGIKNFKQAWNRATYEFAKLKLQRTNVSTKVTSEGILPRINDRVANVDGTNISAQGGEIIAVNGLTISTDRKVDFGISPTGTVLLRNSEGVPSDLLNCEPRTDGVDGFVLTESPSFTIFVRNSDIQVGTLYSFFNGPDADHDANDYLIGQIDPQNDGYVNLILVNYRAEIYDADTTAPPA